MGWYFFGKFQRKFAKSLRYKFPIRENYCILLSPFAIINDFNKAAEHHVKFQELEHGRCSETLLLSSGVSENCGSESRHETKLITWPLFLLWALHAELTVSVHPK